jgi:hypothetical protein
VPAPLRWPGRAGPGRAYLAMRVSRAMKAASSALSRASVMSPAAASTALMKPQLCVRGGGDRGIGEGGGVEEDESESVSQ